MPGKSASFKSLSETKGFDHATLITRVDLKSDTSASNTLTNVAETLHKSDIDQFSVPTPLDNRTNAGSLDLFNQLDLI
jgi:hypothetical protein